MEEYRGNAHRSPLTLLDYFPDEQVSKASLVGLAKVLRRPGDPLDVAVFGACSRAARQLLDESVHAGVVADSDSITVVSVPEDQSKGRGFAFGDLFGPASCYRASVETWGGQQFEATVRRRRFDIALFPGEDPAEVDCLGLVADSVSLMLVGMRPSGEAQSTTFRSILGASSTDWRPFFGYFLDPSIAPGSKRTAAHCIPLASRGTEESIDAFLEGSAGCASAKAGRCVSAPCAASYVISILDSL